MVTYEINFQIAQGSDAVGKLENCGNKRRGGLKHTVSLSRHRTDRHDPREYGDLIKISQAEGASGRDGMRVWSSCRSPV